MKKILWFVAIILCSSSVLAGSYTTNLNLYKPSVGEVGYGALVSNNFQKVDDGACIFSSTVPALSVVGDMVYIDGVDTAALSKADAALTAVVQGVIVEKMTGTTARVRTCGRIEGLAGLTPGADYYLSAATAGKITATAPVAPNKVVKIGRAKNATTLALANSIIEDPASLASGDLQTVYDNSLSGANIDLDLGGDITIRSNASAPFASFDETEEAQYLTRLLGFDGATLDLEAAAGEDILMTSDGGTARLENTGEFVLSFSVVSPLFSSYAGTDTIVQAPVGQAVVLRDASSNPRVTVLAVGSTSVTGDLNVSNEVTSLNVDSVDATISNTATIMHANVDRLAQSMGSYTIAGGEITLGNHGFLMIDTEGAAATDDLDTINPPGGLANGTRIMLHAVDPARLVVLKDGTGNLNLGGANRVLESGITKELVWHDDHWTIILPFGVGTAVVSPGVSTEHAIARWANGNGVEIEDSETILFDDGVALFPTNVIVEGALFAGRSADGSETTSGTIYLSGRAGNQTLMIDARTSSGTDVAGRDSFSFFGPTSPGSPASIESLRITTTTLVVPNATFQTPAAGVFRILANASRAISIRAGAGASADIQADGGSGAILSLNPSAGAASFSACSVLGTVSQFSLDTDGGLTSAQGIIDIGVVGGGPSFRLRTDNNGAGNYDKFSIRGPASPAVGGSVEMMELTTATVIAPLDLEVNGWSGMGTTEQAFVLGAGVTATPSLTKRYVVISADAGGNTLLTAPCTNCQESDELVLEKGDADFLALDGVASPGADAFGFWQGGDCILSGINSMAILHRTSGGYWKVKSCNQS
jgi:hypothetical protein